MRVVCEVRVSRRILCIEELDLELVVLIVSGSFGVVLG